MAGDAVGVGVAGVVAGVMVAAAGAMDMATTVVAASPVDAALPEGAALHVVRLAGSMVAADFVAVLWRTAVADSTVAGVADSTVVAVVGSTAVAVDTAVAVGIGNRRLARNYLIRQHKTTTSRLAADAAGRLIFCSRHKSCTAGCFSC
jgi:hypothetical protein